MSNANGLISAPIGLQPDLYGVQGVQKVGTYFDLGYLTGNTPKKANIWAKNKPFILADFRGAPTDAQRKTGQFGLNMDFHFNPGTAAGLKEIFDTGWNGTNNRGWNYRPPTGGNAAPFRMADFQGYNQNAKVPFFLNAGTGAVTFGGVTGLPTGNITAQDMDALFGWDLTGIGYGLVYTLNDGTPQHIPAINTSAQATYPIVTSAGAIASYTYNFGTAAGTYKVVVYLRSKGGPCIPLPIGGVTVTNAGPAYDSTLYVSIRPAVQYGGYVYVCATSDTAVPFALRVEIDLGGGTIQDHTIPAQSFQSEWQSTGSAADPKNLEIQAVYIGGNSIKSGDEYIYNRVRYIFQY